MAVWWRCRSSWLLIGKRWRPCCVLQFSFNISVQLNIYAVRFKWNCLSRLIRFKNVARFFSLFHCFRRKESYCRPGDGCRDVNVELLVLEKCKWWEILEIKISFSPFSPPPWSFLSCKSSFSVCYCLFHVPFELLKSIPIAINWCFWLLVSLPSPWRPPLHKIPKRNDCSQDGRHSWGRR